MLINDEIKKAISEIATVADLLHQKGWAEGNAGNISINITQILDSNPAELTLSLPATPLKRSYKDLAGQCILMTGTGIKMRELAKQPLKNLLCILITDHGESFRRIPLDTEDNPPLKPTSELPSHLAIHEFLANSTRKEKAIVHTHVNELIALTHDPFIKDEAALNEALQSMHPEVVITIPKGIGLTPYLITGSEEIARATVESLRQHDMTLWEKHGIVSIGNSPTECLDRIEIITKAAKIYFLCRHAGFHPEGLSGRQLEELRAFGY